MIIITDYNHILSKELKSSIIEKCQWFSENSERLAEEVKNSFSKYSEEKFFNELKKPIGSAQKFLICVTKACEKIMKTRPWDNDKKLVGKVWLMNALIRNVLVGIDYMSMEEDINFIKKHMRQLRDEYPTEPEKIKIFNNQLAFFFLNDIKTEENIFNKQ